MLRSSLSLSALTGEAVKLVNIRARRDKPGLMRQHLTAAMAAAEVCGGYLSGAEIGSTEISFRPGSVRGGRYSFAVGTAGSANLVLQTVLPILLYADGPSQVSITGGTHNSGAPPFEFLNECYLPALRQMGHEVTADLITYGFYPAGGGEIAIQVNPVRETAEFVLLDRGPELNRSLEAIVSNLPGVIAERELAVAGDLLEVDEAERLIRTRASRGPGNIIFARIKYEAVETVFSRFGMKGTSSEQVGKQLAKMTKNFAASKAAVSHHLADQLLLPMALGKGGSFATLRPSLHATTNADIIEKFTGRQFAFETADSAHILTVR